MVRPAKSHPGLRQGPAPQKYNPKGGGRQLDQDTPHNHGPTRKEEPGKRMWSTVGGEKKSMSGGEGEVRKPSMNEQLRVTGERGKEHRTKGGNVKWK